MDTKAPTYNSDYLQIAAASNTHTYTFLKSCSGLIGRNSSLKVSGTATLQLVSDTESTYTDALYTFAAEPGQTLTFSNTGSWIGYEIIILI